MKRSVAVCFVFLLVAASQTCFAQDLRNMCFPGDGCTGEVPIINNGYGTCEENCSLKNPERVRGMDATLYDVECVGDNGNYKMRMLFMKRQDAEGNDAIFALAPRGPHLDDEGAVKLNKCEADR